MPILTRQHRLFATSGNTLTGDGNPLSSRIGYDLVQGINNLHYTMPFSAFVAAPTTDGCHNAALISGPSALSGLEVFAAQFPTVVPDGMKRFCWTLGFYAYYLEDGLIPQNFTIDQVSVYIAPSRYTGRTTILDAPAPDRVYAFDVDNLGGTYGKSEYTTPIALPGLDPTPVHKFVNMSTGTTGAILPFDSKVSGSNGWVNEVNIIVTVIPTCASWVGDLYLNFASFSCQWLME